MSLMPRKLKMMTNSKSSEVEKESKRFPTATPLKKKRMEDSKSREEMTEETVEEEVFSRILQKERIDK